jgi:hypothetical protein
VRFQRSCCIQGASRSDGSAQRHSTRTESDWKTPFVTPREPHSSVQPRYSGSTRAVSVSGVQRAWVTMFGRRSRVPASVSFSPSTRLGCTHHRDCVRPLGNPGRRNHRHPRFGSGRHQHLARIATAETRRSYRLSGRRLHEPSAAALLWAIRICSRWRQFSLTTERTCVSQDSRGWFNDRSCVCSPASRICSVGIHSRSPLAARAPSVGENRVRQGYLLRR